MATEKDLEKTENESNQKLEDLIFYLTDDELKTIEKTFERYSQLYPQWRPGQCWFNTYLAIVPQYADRLRGTAHDCFFVDDLILDFQSHFHVKV